MWSVKTLLCGFLDLFLIILIGKSALFVPQSSLEDSVKLHPVFTSSDFATIVFFYITRLSAFSPVPNFENQVPIFMSLSDRVIPVIPASIEFSLCRPAQGVATCYTEYSEAIN